MTVVVETDRNQTPTRTVHANMKCRDVLFRDVAEHCKNDVTPVVKPVEHSFGE